MNMQKSILILLLICNPITLYLLTHSIGVVLIILLIAFLVYYLVECYNQTWAKVLFFNVLLCLSVFYHSELIFKNVFEEYNIPNLYESKGNYYFNKQCLDETFYTPEYNTIYRTDVNGYRIANDKSFFDTKENCDILFLGDSFTQGAQVDYSEMFSSVVEEHFKEFTILNGGISGAGIVEEFNFFKDRGSTLNPQLVILQIGVFNDFMDVRERHQSVCSYLIEKSSLFRYLYYNMNENEELPLGRWTEPIFPDERTNIELNILYKKSCSQKELDKKKFVEYLIRFKEECTRIKADFVVALIPSKEQISINLFNECIRTYGLDKENFDLSYPNRWLSRICIDNDIRLIDLYDTFKESELFPFFSKDEHMNKVGHKIVGTEIIEYIDRNKFRFK